MINPVSRRVRLCLVMFSAIFFSVSCSSTTAVNREFFASPERKPVIGLVSYRSQYIKPSSGAFLGEEAGGRMSIEGDDEYRDALDEKCLGVIEETLKSKTVPFSFNRGPFNNAPELENLDIPGLENVNMSEDTLKTLKEEAKDRNANLIRKFVAENHLDGAIRIENHYGHVGASFKLAMYTYWTIYDNTGDTVLFIVTESVDDETRSFAYMMDTKLENEIIVLTGENAKKLLSAFRD